MFSRERSARVSVSARCLFATVSLLTGLVAYPVLAQTTAGADGAVVRTYTRTYTNVDGTVTSGKKALPAKSAQAPTPVSDLTPKTATTTYVRRILSDGTVQIIKDASVPPVGPPVEQTIPSSYSSKQSVVRRYRILPDGSRVEVTPEDGPGVTPKPVTKTASDVTPPPVPADIAQTVRAPQSQKSGSPYITASTVTKSQSPPATLPGVVPDLGTLYLILWSTFTNIATAQSGEDIDAMWRTLSPRLQSELSADTLQASLKSLSDSQLNPGEAVGKMPVFEIAPHIIRDGRMRLRGTVRTLAGKDIRFDLLYVHHDGLWRLDAIAFAKA